MSNGLPDHFSHVPQDVVDRAKKIKLFATDVDGVLTDGGIIWDANVVEQKKFNVKDGWALIAVKKLGIKTAIITGRGSAVVEHRGTELKFDYIHQNVKDKGACLDTLLAELGISDDEVAYMGDDVPDLPILERCGLAVVPSDALPEAKAHAHFITEKAGGEGCVRELLDIIRYAQGQDDVGKTGIAG